MLRNVLTIGNVTETELSINKCHDLSNMLCRTMQNGVFVIQFQMRDLYFANTLSPCLCEVSHYLLEFCKTRGN